MSPNVLLAGMRDQSSPPIIRTCCATTVVERTTDSQQRLSSPLVYGLLI